MPSFANPNGDSMPNMADVFKTHPSPEVLTDLLARSRARARDILQVDMPGKITHLTKLLEGENDPSSCLWVGHLDTDAYKPKLYQPNAPELQHLNVGPLVRPADVLHGMGGVVGVEDAATDASGCGGCCSSGPNGCKPNEVAGEDAVAVKGLRNGMHWYEVLVGNDIQRELCQLVIREQEDLNLMAQDLKVWLDLEIPIIEDGNSFGADVQASLIRDLEATYKKTNAMQNGCRAHFNDRVRIAQEWAKFPNMLDYPASLAANDRFDHCLMRTYIRSLLFTYGGLLTKFEKNWAKVISPKGNAGGNGGMY